ncbi:hypothetical protein N0V94_008119 [Neodidymelliopsis sp. IMI 364377]|nr:hypothetical protein N0V94_008119 [Neodidymelliopsis sp. IMI 364377]
MRSGAEARRFFVVGKVFAMFYSEAAGGQANRNGNDEAYSMARFGEVVHSQIRRFIVVKVCQGFVYACGISTYSGRGTNKYGCVPSEYAVAYFSGTDTTYCYLDGEYQNGMIKDPIEVIPVDYDLRMKPESRIRFSKTFPIEMNIKVKDIGRVHPEHISKLLEYWNEYNNQG